MEQEDLQADMLHIHYGIHYITIANTGNTTDFGDFTVARNNVAGCG